MFGEALSSERLDADGSNWSTELSIFSTEPFASYIDEDQCSIYLRLPRILLSTNLQSSIIDDHCFSITLDRIVELNEINSGSERVKID